MIVADVDGLDELIPESREVLACALEGLVRAWVQLTRDAAEAGGGDATVEFVAALSQGGPGNGSHSVLHNFALDEVDAEGRAVPDPNAARHHLQRAAVWVMVTPGAEGFRFPDERGG